MPWREPERQLKRIDRDNDKTTQSHGLNGQTGALLAILKRGEGHLLEVLDVRSEAVMNARCQSEGRKIEKVSMHEG